MRGVCYSLLGPSSRRLGVVRSRGCYSSAKSYALIDPEGGRYENEPKDTLGAGQARQYLPSYRGGQESVVPPEARDELAGDMSKDNEWLYAAAADPALYLKDV